MSWNKVHSIDIIKSKGKIVAKTVTVTVLVTVTPRYRDSNHNLNHNYLINVINVVNGKESYEVTI